MGMGDGVCTNGAEWVGIQLPQFVGTDAERLVGIPPHGTLIVDEARGDINGERHPEPFQQWIGEGIVIVVAIIESDADKTLGLGI